MLKPDRSQTDRVRRRASLSRIRRRARLAESGIGAETRQVCENLRQILEAAGSNARAPCLNSTIYRRIVDELGARTGSSAPTSPRSAPPAETSVRAPSSVTRAWRSRRSRWRREPRRWSRRITLDRRPAPPVISGRRNRTRARHRVVPPPCLARRRLADAPHPPRHGRGGPLVLCRDGRSPRPVLVINGAAYAASIACARRPSNSSSNLRGSDHAAVRFITQIITPDTQPPTTANVMYKRVARGFARAIDAYVPPPLTAMTRRLLALNRFDIVDTIADEAGRISGTAGGWRTSGSTRPGTVMHNYDLKVIARSRLHHRSTQSLRLPLLTRRQLRRRLRDTGYPRSSLALNRHRADVLVHEVMHLAASRAFSRESRTPPPFE